MKFWMLSHTDALPGELGFDRSIQTAHALQQLGHEVIWWNAGFSHAEKKTRATEVTVVPYGNGLNVILLPVRSYRSNQSLGRLLSIFDFAWQFARQQHREPRPDAILVCGPILFIEPALLYLKWRHGVPVVFEFRDLWPEAIINSVKGPQRWLRRLVFLPSLFMRGRLLRASDGIIGLNRTYLAVALRAAGCGVQPRTGVSFPSPRIGPPDGTPPTTAPGKPPGEIWALSSGTLGASHDHDTLLAAARELQATAPRLRIIVTGGGPYAGEFARRIAAEGLHNVCYLGALPSVDFQAVLRSCDIGIALYRQFSPVVLPTKIVDYLLTGLAIVTSAQGEIADMLRETGAGHVVSPEAVSPTSAALAQLANTPTHLEAVRAAARQLARQFDHERQMAVITDMLVDVARRRSADAAH